MTDFGTCQHEGCERTAIVGLNGRHYCLVHFDVALEAFTVKRAREQLREKAQPPR